LEGIEIRQYRAEDEEQWLRCRVLAFLDTAYYDNVLREKERYQHPAIEIVAVLGSSVVGLIDVECECVPNTVCSNRPGLGAMIWHLAVHPDWRRKGIGTVLLSKAKAMAAERRVVRLEAWTRDDAWVQRWYESQGFKAVDSYLHVYIEGRDELKGAVRSEIPGLMPVQAFAHYQGDDPETIGRRFRRVHRCVLYELRI
jgi:ribosomal protein S18 acetylase RimI-like enzyme